MEGIDQVQRVAEKVHGQSARLAADDPEIEWKKVARKKKPKTMKKIIIV